MLFFFLIYLKDNLLFTGNAAVVNSSGGTVAYWLFFHYTPIRCIKKHQQVKAGTDTGHPIQGKVINSKVLLVVYCFSNQDKVRVYDGPLGLHADFSFT